MKKNRLYIFILSALLPLLWLACSKESSTDAPIEPASQGKYPVTFSLEKGLTATPKTYASVTALEGERKVSEMVALVFNTADGKFIGAPLPVTVSGQVGEDQATTDSKLTGSFDLGKKYGQTGKQIKFVLVANVSVAAMQSELTNLVTSVTSANAVTDLTLDDIKTLKIFNAPDVQQQFVMLSMQEPQVTLQENTAQNVSSTIIMRRLSARIDTNIGSGSNNDGLTLQKVVVKKSQQESYLYEKGGSTVHLSSGETDKEITGLSGTTHTTYTYENSVAGDTHLEVTLALNGVPLAPIEVPFTGVAIERNHIYKVTFNRDAGDVTNPSDPNQNAPKITFKIDVNDWDVESASYIEDYANKTAPTIFKVAAMQSDWATPVNPTTITLNPDNTKVGVQPAAHYLAVEVHSKSTQSEAVVTSGSSWVNVSDVTTYASGMQQQFQVEVEENTTDESRTATIEFRNKLEAAQKITLTITQDTKQSPESEYAKGFNNPLVPMSYFSTTQVNRAGDDFVSEEDIFNTNKSGYFNWYYTTGTYNSSYNTGTGSLLAGKAAFNGYRVPSKQEWATIFEDQGDESTYYIFRINSGSKSEPIDAGDGVKSYTCEYSNPSGSAYRYITYAIRLIGHGNTYRAAYRYEWVPKSGSGELSYAKVTIRHLGNDGTQLSDVNNEAYWNSNTTNDVIRIFPILGYASSNSSGGLSGSPTYVNSYAHYWSSSAKHPNSGAWFTLVRNGYAYASNDSGKYYAYSVRLVRNKE